MATIGVVAKVDIPINSHNEDIAVASAFWYGPEEVFISQKETDTNIEHLLLFGRDGAKELVDALQAFLRPPAGEG